MDEFRQLTSTGVKCMGELRRTWIIAAGIKTYLSKFPIQPAISVTVRTMPADSRTGVGRTRGLLRKQVLDLDF